MFTFITILIYLGVPDDKIFEVINLSGIALEIWGAWLLLRGGMILRERMPTYQKLRESYKSFEQAKTDDEKQTKLMVINNYILIEVRRSLRNLGLSEKKAGIWIAAGLALQALSSLMSMAV